MPPIPIIDHSQVGGFQDFRCAAAAVELPLVLGD